MANNTNFRTYIVTCGCLCYSLEEYNLLDSDKDSITYQIQQKYFVNWNYVPKQLKDNLELIKQFVINYHYRLIDKPKWLEV